MNVTAADVKVVIAEEVDVQRDAEKLQEDVALSAQGIDSLDMYTLYLAIEEKFGVSIPDEAIADLQSIQSIVAYIREKRNA